MKFTSLVACQKALLVLCLICCSALTVAAENYYPSEIGNTWVLVSTDGSEQLTYTLEESENTDVEGLIVLKIITETIGTDTISTDIYNITVDDGSLLLHQSITDQGALGIAEAIYEPPVTFFPADLPIGHTWQILTETTLDLVGAVTSTSTIEVVAIEDVQTPAGLFENCVKLEINQKDKTPFTVLRKTSYQWLAPDVGPVKFLNNQKILFELNSYNIIEPTTESPPMVVSIEQKPTKDSQHIKIGIQLNSGKDVAGYSAFVAFDATVLKYISSTQGNYLQSGGVFIRPMLQEDDTYNLSLDVGDATQTGTTVSFVEQQLSVSDFLFQIPEVPPEFSRPGAEYWGISILGSAPLGEDTLPIAKDGDGTLVSLTFEVVDPDTPAIIALPDLMLSDAFDMPLPVAIQQMVITNLMPLVDENLLTDVNGDGKVNILDLVNVASNFGEPISDENAAADVNGDGEINILDLVLIAKDFGKSTTAPVDE
ncbi:hypothetical protein C6497_10860 [Candidatus Poribacteria bacterium]|nr:MAG: hypothetical protein C6497_10860 [Candidatus Poribacteria bacterium]